jgi:hypothetical protein
MLDWRHKVLLRFFVSIASLLYISKWLWETKNVNAQTIIFIPFLLATICSIAFYIMDKRNMKVVKVCRDTGKQIEKKFFKTHGLFINMGPAIDQTRNLFSYTGMLTLLYLGSAITLFLCSICAFIKFKGWSMFNIILK